MYTKKHLVIMTTIALLAMPTLISVNASANSNIYRPTKSFKVFNYHGNVEPFILHAGERYKGIGGIGGNKEIAIPGHSGVYYIHTGDAWGHGAQYANTSNSNNSTVKHSQPVTNNTQVDKSNQPTYQNSKTNNGKLVQTNENNTGVKFGIIGTIVAIAFIIFASISKFFKHA